jgi:hypothetical protein
LLEQQIEYSPIERELIWTATDPIESANPKTLTRLMQTRLLCSSLFHEQSHRLLWNFLPPPSCSLPEVTRYLNFVESLVVTLDMALGDELGHGISRIFYLSGVTYDPGTDIRSEGLSPRVYRNYLHACLYGTYMKLQFFDDTDIKKAIHHLFPASSPQGKRLVDRAVHRALRLDDDFVQKTNPSWQENHIDTVIRKLGKKNPAALVIPESPLENHIHYFWAERWFDFFIK